MYWNFVVIDGVIKNQLKSAKYVYQEHCSVIWAEAITLEIKINSMCRTVMCVFMGPPRLWPLPYCTASYRSALSSDKEPRKKKTK
jgi:hypothetical protein